MQKTEFQGSRFKENLLLVSLLLVVITIPLDNNWNSKALILFCFSAVIQFPFRQHIRKIKADRYWIISALFFFWLSATWFWDITGGFSIKYIESYALFVAIPLMMVIIPKLSRKKIQLVCLTFIATVIVVTLICLIKAYLSYRENGDYRVFSYHYLGYQMNLNAVYLSNYCIACITWLLYYRFIDKTGNFRFSSTLVIIVCAYLFMIIFLLSSKLSIAILLLLSVFFALYIGYLKRALLKSVLVLALLATCAVLLIKNIDYLKWRVSVTALKKYSGPEDDQNGFAVRMVSWQSAVELIRKRPFLGYGLKGSAEALVEKYRAKDFQLGIPEKYNSHNQFLETTLRSGIPGLVLLMLLLIVPLISAFRYKNFLLALMLLHFMTVSLVEGALEYQQELVFYWFFIFLFYYHPYNPKIGTSNT